MNHKRLWKTWMPLYVVCCLSSSAVHSFIHRLSRREKLSLRRKKLDDDLRQTCSDAMFQTDELGVKQTFASGLIIVLRKHVSWRFFHHHRDIRVWFCAYSSDHYKPLTRFYCSFLLFNYNKSMAQQAPEFKLVLVGDGGVGKCRKGLGKNMDIRSYLVVGFSF